MSNERMSLSERMSLKAEIGRLRGEREALAKEILEARDIIETARALLRQHQHYQYRSHDEGWAECICCGAEGRTYNAAYEYLPGPCEPGCELAAFLGGPSGEAP